MWYGSRPLIITEAEDFSTQEPVKVGRVGGRGRGSSIGRILKSGIAAKR